MGRAELQVTPPGIVGGACVSGLWREGERERKGSEERAEGGKLKAEMLKS
jgi:hypothetical protein